MKYFIYILICTSIFLVAADKQNAGRKAPGKPNGNRNANNVAKQVKSAQGGSDKKPCAPLMFQNCCIMPPLFKNESFSACATELGVDPNKISKGVRRQRLGSKNSPKIPDTANNNAKRTRKARQTQNKGNNTVGGCGFSDIVSCVMRKDGYLTADNKLIESALLTSLSSLADSKWKDKINAAAKKCYDEVLKLSDKTLKIGNCNMIGTYYLTCVRRELTINCQDKTYTVNGTDKPHDTKCTDNLNKLGTCDFATPPKNMGKGKRSGKKSQQQQQG